jgi:hypothetical protein
MAHLAFAHLTLTRLLFLNDTCWDAASARKSIDYPEVVGRLADYFETVDRVRSERHHVHLQHDDKRPSRAEKLRWARTWYLSKSPPQNEAPTATAATPATSNMLGTAMNEPPSMAYLDALGPGIASTYWQTLFDSEFGM